MMSVENSHGSTCGRKRLSHELATLRCAYKVFLLLCMTSDSSIAPTRAGALAPDMHGIRDAEEGNTSGSSVRVTARNFVAILVDLVRPPSGVEIVVTEHVPINASDTNWVAAINCAADEVLTRFTDALVTLRVQRRRIAWTAVTDRNGRGQRALRSV